MDKAFIDPSEEENITNFIEKEFFHDSYLLHPGKFTLAQTFEYISLPDDIVGIIDGKSSIGRRGIVVHATAGYVDPGFKGHLVFELANLGEMPVKLYPLMRIARVVFYRTNNSLEYQGQFKGQLSIPLPIPDEEVGKIKAYHEENI